MPVAKLDNAPRCQHTRAGGSSCKAPALRNLPYCHFHLYVRRPAKPHMVPFVEDAHSLQLAIHQVLRALADGSLERKTASTMLYGLQIAASNLKRLAEEREPIDAEAEGRRHMSLAQYLIDQLDLEPEEEHVDAGAPACMGERSSPDASHPTSALGASAPSRSSSTIPAIHACSQDESNTTGRPRRIAGAIACSAPTHVAAGASPAAPVAREVARSPRKFPGTINLYPPPRSRHPFCATEGL
ncbi:MAG TPA: hypothetical protein VFU76_03670 [Terriglobales bacterium]|nr:hypothetical protein [Terriglobales bacterium]